MRICKYLLALTLLLFSCDMMAQQEMPFISPTATFINSAGEEEESTSYSGSAPVKAIFRANPSNIGSYYPYYEWRFYKEGEGSIEGEKEPYLIRYEEETEYTFKEAGSHRVACYASFVNGVDTIAYDDVESFTISISESKLEMPNAFSPNGDDINDTYKVKEYQSKVVIGKGDKSAEAQKLMAVMSLGVKCGETVTVTIEGDDEEDAAPAIQAFFNENL